MARASEGAASYRLDWRDGLAVVHLTCGKANALNARTLAAIERALDEATGGDARALVLTGYERFFSAGLDLVTLYGLERDAMDGFMAWFDALMLRVFAFPRPVVAAIGGHAVAGGGILALACDARLMGARAGRFGLNEIQLGVPFPASALEIVRYAVPPGSVEEVLYGGELFDARVALGRGLVTEVVEGDVVEAACRVAGRLAAAPAGAFETIKAGLKGPAVERARATLAPLRRAFVDAWYAPEARRRIGEARARLGG
ncbi:MAG TPA: enoyl-CoA hydratase/isomerase family protein [Methylomirabilota bacterium]|jgi:enoyl-CoA hydratase